jgi:hypothetical protein
MQSSGKFDSLACHCLWLNVGVPARSLRPAIEINATREGSRRTTTCENGRRDAPGAPRQCHQLKINYATALDALALQKRHGRHRDRRPRLLIHPRRSRPPAEGLDPATCGDELLCGVSLGARVRAQRARGRPSSRSRGSCCRSSSRDEMIRNGSSRGTFRLFTACAIVPVSA